MNSYAKIFYMHVISALFIVNTASADQWPFPVTDKCAPILSINIISSATSDDLFNFSVAHEIIDNGDRCMSKIYIPQISSYFSYVNPDHCLWRQFNGSIITFSMHSLSEVIDGWKILRLGEDRFSMSNESSTDYYSYFHTRLIFAVINNHKYFFAYDIDRLTSVREENGVEVVDARIFYDARGRLKSIKWNGKMMDIRYNSNDQIEACYNEHGVSIFEAVYSDYLLSEVTIYSNKQHFVWHMPRNCDYSTDPITRIPMITSDNLFNYDPVIRDGLLWVYFKNKYISQSGFWIKNLRTDKFVIHWDN